MCEAEDVSGPIRRLCELCPSSWNNADDKRHGAFSLIEAFRHIHHAAVSLQQLAT